MNVWNLLGFGTNWDRINKIQERERLEYIGTIIHSITCLNAYENGMEGIVNEYGAKEVYKVIKTFGKEIPTRTKYDKFQDYVSTSDLVPSARQVRKNEYYQEKWTVAYNWAMTYEKTKIEIVIAEKEEWNIKIKELEEKIKALENKIANSYEKE